MGSLIGGCARPVATWRSNLASSVKGVLDDAFQAVLFEPHSPGRARSPGGQRRSDQPGRPGPNSACPRVARSPARFILEGAGGKAALRYWSIGPHIAVYG